MTTTSQLHLKYEGSVKRVWTPPATTGERDELLWFEFTDDYSVFDWGKMPDTIAHKGQALTILGAFFFEKLTLPGIWTELKTSAHLSKFDRTWLDNLFASQTYKNLEAKGCPSHYRRITCPSGERLSLARVAQGKETSYMEVEAAEVLRPTPAVVLNQTVFEYPTIKEEPSKRLVPLEVVFRFGMPAGSSLVSRLKADPGYAFVLGLPAVPEENQFFPHPVIELYTKLEPKDRLLSVQEALLLSGIGAGKLQSMSELAFAIALALYNIFAERGIELWDGKFEFILKDGNIALADTIGPDELRLIYKKCHLSKEMVRRVYRSTPWEQSLKEAQRLAAERTTLDWKGICREELKQTPEPFTQATRAVIDQLYGVLTNHVCGQPLFSDHPTLDEFVEKARRENLAEA